MHTYGIWASLMTQLVKNHMQCRRPGFDPWVGKISWRRERLPTPILWPGEFHGLYSPWGRKESDATDRLSLSFSVSLFLCGAHLGISSNLLSSSSAFSSSISDCYLTYIFQVLVDCICNFLEVMFIFQICLSFSEK